MVLDRMSVFAAPDMPRRWALAGRVVMAAVVLGNAVGLAANAAAAVYYQSAAQATSTSSAAYAANNIKDGDYFNSLGQQEASAWWFQLIRAVVLRGCRSAPHCRRVCCSWSVERAPRELQVAPCRRCFRCCGDGQGAAAAGCWAPPRSFSLHFFSGLCSQQCLPFLFYCEIAQADCPSFCDTSCRNVYAVITYWMTYTPEFQLIVMLISSPARSARCAVE